MQQQNLQAHNLDISIDKNRIGFFKVQSNLVAKSISK